MYIKKLFNKTEYASKRKNLRSKLTKSEVLLWNRLRGKQLNQKFRRQHGVGPYVIDFYCPDLQLAIEIDGLSHETGDVANNDLVRQSFLESQGITVLRFNTLEVFTELDRVVENIYQTTEQLQAVRREDPHPDLPLSGGG